MQREKQRQKGEKDYRYMRGTTADRKTTNRCLLFDNFFVFCVFCYNFFVNAARTKKNEVDDV